MNHIKLELVLRINFSCHLKQVFSVTEEYLVNDFLFNFILHATTICILCLNLGGGGGGGDPTVPATINLYRANTLQGGWS